MMREKGKDNKIGVNEKECTLPKRQRGGIFHYS